MSKNPISKITESLFQDACRDYQESELCTLLQEKWEQMHESCHSMFMQDEEAFAEECFTLLTNIGVHQQRFAYQQGLLDCVSILKHLKILE